MNMNQSQQIAYKRRTVGGASSPIRSAPTAPSPALVGGSSALAGLAGFSSMNVSSGAKVGGNSSVGAKSNYF